MENIVTHGHILINHVLLMKQNGYQEILMDTLKLFSVKVLKDKLWVSLS